METHMAETGGKLRNRKAWFATSESCWYHHLDECCMRVGVRVCVVVLRGYG